MYIEPPTESEINEDKIVYMTLDMLDDVPFVFHPLIGKLIEQGLVKVVLDGPNQIM